MLSEGVAVSDFVDIVSSGVPVYASSTLLSLALYPLLVVQVVPDLSLARRINDVSVKCESAELGCTWTGSIRDYNVRLLFN